MRWSEGDFEAGDGLRLYEQSWLPEGEAKARVVIIHGYGEHSARYQHVARALVERGYAVHAFDLRGHGRSEGPRAFVKSVETYVADARRFLSRLPSAPTFVLGHSMGGTIVALGLITRALEARGAVLSGAALKARGGVARLFTPLVRLLGRLAPRLQLGKLSAERVSRDPAVVAAYENDPLVYHDGMRAGTARALVNAVREIERRMEEIEMPLLALHGTSDQLTEPDGSRRLYRQARSEDKTLRLYDDLYHEILNEPEQERVLADIVAWLEART